MKQILNNVIIILILFFSGCNNSLDIPKIEGTYERIYQIDDGTILSKNQILVKKIGKNKYSFQVSEFNDSSSLGNFDIYQEFEIVEVKKDREKTPLIYTFGINELSKGTGSFELFDKKNKLTAMRIFSVSFCPKTASDPTDRFQINSEIIGDLQTRFLRFYSFRK